MGFVAIGAKWSFIGSRIRRTQYTIKKNSPLIGVSHASLLPGKRNVWLEGIRVNPKYRRRYVATELINKMVLYGKRQGAKEASAMVSKSKYCFSVNDGKERFLRRF